MEAGKLKKELINTPPHPKVLILRLIIFVLLVSLIFVFTNKTIYAETDLFNLAPNPSFEEGSISPTDWQTFEGPMCSNDNIDIPLNTEWDTTKALSGTRSLSIKNITWNNSNGMPGGWITSDFIPLVYSPNDYFAIEVKVLGENASNLRGAIGICIFNSNNQLLKIEGDSRGITTNGTWGTIIRYLQIKDTRWSKIKVSFHAACQTNNLCSGSLWYDDVKIRPLATILAHTFEDLDRDGVYVLNEPSLPYWGINFYTGSSCLETNRAFTGAATNQNGLLSYFNVVGEYSVKQTFIRVKFGPPLSFPDVRTEGWINTTPICQNVTLRAGETPTVHFGNVQLPTFPYFSQKHQAWGGQIYDHADSIGPFFCGTTIAGCGCAITSAAMLLKYHGVNNAPNGQETTPETLNNWLKANNGYAFGALKWPSVTSYAFKAWQVYNTQSKIKFTGVGGPNDYSTLDHELNNNSPPILQQPGHFIVATGIQSPTYSINDPAWENRTTLESYNNQFKSMRRFAKTSTDLSAIQISAPAPTEIFVTDSKGKRTGKDPQTGQTYSEIPNSYYTIEPAYADQTQGNPQLPDPSNGVTTLVILTPQSQTFNSQIFGSPEYSIDFSAYDVDGNTNVQQFENIPNGGIQNFEVSYSPTDITQLTVTQIVDIDIKPGSDPNSINLKSNGFIPVAILTSEDFDAATIDPHSIKFGPNEIDEAHQTGHLEDINNDQDIDLVLHFKTQETGILADDVEVCLEGMTFTGIPFLGCDTVRIVGNDP